MKMKRINFIWIFIVSCISNSMPTWAITCSTVLKNETPVLKSYNKALGEILVYSIPSTHPYVEEIIDQALLLQKLLLINKKSTKEITDLDIKDGFLVEEMDTNHLKRDLIHDHGSIMTACIHNHQSSHNKLAGYAILRSTSDYDQNKNAIHGEATFSISENEWQKIAVDSTYIYELDVYPNYRRKGVGKLIIEACKKQCSNALIVDVICWPKPFVNKLSYQLFLKNGFRDVGEVYIENSPGFQSYKSRIMLWK